MHYDCMEINGVGRQAPYNLFELQIKHSMTPRKTSRTVIFFVCVVKKGIGDLGLI